MVRNTQQSAAPIKYMGLINKVDMVCLSPVGYGVLAHAEKQFFSNLVFQLSMPIQKKIIPQTINFLMV